MKDSDVRLMLFDLAKIIEGALAGDAEKVRAYAEQAGRHLREIGKFEFANRIDQILGKAPNPTLTLQ
jgi:hypothetical protein